MSKSETERTALVTGANRGIGLAIARGLAETGMTVFLGARDLKAGEEAVHLAGPLCLIRLTAPGMVARGYGRIVNLSSGWGAFAEGLGGPGLYGVTKAALNALTVRLGEELPRQVKVNAMCPGWVRTRMGGRSAPRSPAEGADTAIWLATLPADGPTGGFFRNRRPIPW